MMNILVYTILRLTHENDYRTLSDMAGTSCFLPVVSIVMAGLKNKSRINCQISKYFIVLNESLNEYDE